MRCFSENGIKNLILLHYFFTAEMAELNILDSETLSHTSQNSPIEVWFFSKI